MARDALEMVSLRNDFYRDNYRKVMTALLVAVIAIVCLVAALVVTISNRPSPKYFATTSSGKLIPMQPLNFPFVTTQNLLQWASKASSAAFTFNFVNYREQLQSSEQYFTAEGWKQFITQLNSSGNLSAIKDRKLIASAIPAGAPVILNQGELAGRYAWRVQIPMIVTYQGANNKSNNAMMVTMTVTRVPTLDNSSGVGISQINVTQQ